MQDGEHDALHLPGLGDPSTVAQSLDTANNKLLVVATLAAIILAGSAIVYRTIPLYLYPNSTATASGQKDAVHKPQKRKMLEPLHEGEKRAEREEEDPAYEDRPGARKANGSLVVPSFPTTQTEDYDSKESKTSRSKDRRRRGKDPLKEILKSEKKSRGLGGASPTLSYRDSTPFIKSSSAKDDPTPSSPSTSLFSDSQFSRIDSEKSSKTKRAAAQRENSNIGPDDTTSDRSQQARGSAAGTTSVTHSRGTSESISASEIIQRQHLADRLDSRSPSATSSQTLPSSDLHHNPYTSHHSRPSSSLASDDGLGRPLSSMSMSTASSAGSHQVSHVDDHDGLLKWATVGKEKSTKRRRATSSQARHLGLASEDEDGGHTHHDTITYPAADSSSAIPSTSTAATSLPSAYPGSHSNFTSRSALSNASASASTETTATTTGPASLSSSLVLSSGGMTPATSPTLSHGSISSATGATSKGKATEAGDIGRARDKTVDTTKSSKTAKSRTNIQQIGSSSTVNSDTRDPWDWDGAGSVPSSSSSYLEEGDIDLAKDKDAEREKAKEKEHYQKPPRLQQGGAAPGKGQSFSAIAANRLPASSTHPTSLYSPTSSSFGQAISGGGSGISASVSATPASGGGSTNPTSPSLGSDSGYSLGELRERDEEEAFTFPTLNPTTVIAGSSRTRSSVVDNNINNINNTNTNHYNSHNSPSTSRRAPTPRRPPTPARSNSTPPPPHPSSSSSSSPHLGHNHSSLNSPTSHPGSANGNGSMPALSTQTQLASLRGALEAARLREEKNKQDMEKFVKEMDILKWENSNWRRGEVELQTHIRHLMHQLQTYAALVTSVTPQLQQQQQQQQQQQVNGAAGAANPAAVVAGSTPSTSAAPNGYGAAASGSNSVPATPQVSTSPVPGAPQPQLPQQQQTAATHPPPPPLYIQQMLSNLQMNGLPSPGGMLSPLAMSTPPLLMGMHPGATSSSFFPYPMPPPPPPHPLMMHAQQMQYMQQQYQQQGSAQPSPHQANLFSSIFPPGPVPPPLMSPHQQHQYSAYVASQQAVTSTSSNVYGSRSSSVTGTSSTGSVSPDLNGSPSPGGLNGNRRARTRTLTANGVRPTWEDVGDGWIGVGGAEEGGAPGDETAEGDDGERGEGDDEDRFSEGGLNEVLVDAILKRPGSIRVRSSSRRGKLNMEQEAEKEEENGVLPKEKAEVEQLTEFTFPSLSNLGNVLYKSDVIAVNGGLSSSSSSSASPAPRPIVDVVADVAVSMADEQPFTDPADVGDILIDPGVSKVEGKLESSEPDSTSPSSNGESDATPRKELLESSVTAEPLPTSEDPSEQDLQQSQEIVETNSLPLEQ